MPIPAAGTTGSESAIRGQIAAFMSPMGAAGLSACSTPGTASSAATTAPAVSRLP